MGCSSFLSSESNPLVIDTSVIINLHACGYGERILRALHTRLVVPDLVLKDLEHETSKANGEYQFVKDMDLQSVVERCEFDAKAWEIYEELVTGPSSLGDGEASVVAIAASQGFVPVLDDAKGRRHANRLVPVCGWSLDIFLHPNVRSVMTDTELIEAIYLALHEGRMRIDDERCEEVVELIGVDRATMCPSLPRYKSRWRVQQQ